MTVFEGVGGIGIVVDFVSAAVVVVSVGDVVGEVVVVKVAVMVVVSVIDVVVVGWDVVIVVVVIAVVVVVGVVSGGVGEIELGTIDKFFTSKFIWLPLILPTLLRTTFPFFGSKVTRIMLIASEDLTK